MSASAAVAASPTISKPGTAASSSAIPRRTTSWSSSRKMRIGVSDSVMRSGAFQLTIGAAGGRRRRQSKLPPWRSARACRLASPLARSIFGAMPTPLSVTVTVSVAGGRGRRRRRPGRLRMLGDVGQRLAHARRDVVGQPRARRCRPRRRTPRAAGSPAPGSGRSRSRGSAARRPSVRASERPAQREDAGADLADRAVEVVHPLLHALGRRLVRAEHGATLSRLSPIANSSWMT